MGTGFDSLHDFLGLSSYHDEIFRTVRPVCSHFYHYNENGEVTAISLSILHRDIALLLTLIAFVFRHGRSLDGAVCAMKVFISDLSCVTLVYYTRSERVSEIEAFCIESEELLRNTPLGFLSIMMRERSRTWETWLAGLWLDLNEIEIFTKMGPEDWNFNPPTAERVKVLEDKKEVLTQLFRTGVQLSHALTLMPYGVRLAQFCCEVIDVVEAAGGERLTPRIRNELQARLRFDKSKCIALQDRVNDLMERHKSMINLVRVPLSRDRTI